MRGPLVNKLLARAYAVLPAKLMESKRIPEEARENIRNAPPCALECMLDKKLVYDHAPECMALSGQALGRTLCMNQQFQLEFYECLKRKCGPQQAERVPPPVLGFD
jgi:hypothetical protein